MIRVNLLPHKREAARNVVAQPGQSWIFAVFGVVALEIVGLLVLQHSKQEELSQLARHNQEIEANINEIKRQTANHADIKAQLKQLRDREEAIEKLQAARSGPTAVMLELSRMLTSGRGPTVDRDKLEQLRRDNPAMVHNPNWDPRRLWVTAYSEVERSVKMVGSARDGEDVSEFLRRLALSDFFYEVKLLPAAKAIDPETKLDMVRFELSAKVRY